MSIPMTNGVIHIDTMLKSIARKENSAWHHRLTRYFRKPASFTALQRR